MKEELKSVMMIGKKASQTFRKSLSSATVPWTTKEILKVVICSYESCMKFTKHDIVSYPKGRNYIKC